MIDYRGYAMVIREYEDRLDAAKRDIARARADALEEAARICDELLLTVENDSFAEGYNVAVKDAVEAIRGRAK